jgi:hypothetical protein
VSITSDKTHRLIHSRRRHYHTTKRSFLSYLSTSDVPASAQDVLVDGSRYRVFSGIW